MMMHKDPFKLYVNVLDHNIAIMHQHIHILNDLGSHCAQRNGSTYSSLVAELLVSLGKSPFSRNEASLVKHMENQLQ